MIYISIDLETSGLDENNHQILEFGAVVEDTNNVIPMDELPTYHAYITHPKNQIIGDIFALNLNAGIIEKLKNKKELKDKYNYVRIDELADDFLFWLHSQGFELKTKYEGTEKEYRCTTINVAGKNFDSFDRKFLDNVPDFSKKIRMRLRTLDPSILFVDWKNDDTLPTLDEAKQKAGISGAVTHLAVDDAKDVIELLRKSYAN